jgi:hypothetical protein
MRDILASGPVALQYDRFRGFAPADIAHLPAAIFLFLLRLSFAGGRSLKIKGPLL